MKKIFSVLLAVMMVFSMSATAFAADFKDVDNTHEYYEAIETLSTLKIVSGYDDGRFDPDNELTRAQACTILVRAFGGDPRNYPTNIFTDVTNHWAKNFIHEAYYMGLVSGYGNGIFGPNDKITYDQVSQMILNALGYTVEGTWPTSVRTVAKNAGLYEDVTIIDGSAPCNRGVICQMVYNAFDCITIGNNGFPTGKTLLASLGYEETYPEYEEVKGEKTGNLVTTYIDENGKTYTTSLVVSDFYSDVKFNNDKTVIIENDKYSVSYNDCVVIIDSEEIKELRTTKLIDAENIDAVVYEDRIVALIGTNIDSIVDPSDDVIEELGNDYIEGISTVTKVGNSYEVSNDTTFGYVIDTYSKKDNCYIELSDGEIITLETENLHNGNNITDFEQKYVVFFYDYRGNVSDYKIFEEIPQVDNTTTENS